jgi:hypothetical protein
MATVHGAPHLHQRQGTGGVGMTHRDGNNGQDREELTPTCEGMADVPGPGDDDQEEGN